jgi:hypothetical protein
MGQTTTEPPNFLNCEFLEPRVVNKSGEVITFIYPNATNQNFQYSKMNCSSTAFEIINATSGESFVLNKSWDYGELMIVFLMILFFFLLIFILVFNFFFEPVFKIRGKK